jgi:hypothetical protein
MRQTISGLVAAIAVMAASTAPAMACGGLFNTCASGCGYVSPCAQTYVPADTYGGCNTGCGWGYERLPDPVVQYHTAPAAQPQYYYVEQGPTYTGPGDFAPRRVYREGGVSGWGGYRHHHHYYGHHGYMWHHHIHYGYGYREHVLRRYY